jgi:hypothetical protein
VARSFGAKLVSSTDPPLKPTNPSKRYASNDISWANLVEADLSRAYLGDHDPLGSSEFDPADLTDADLRGARLPGAELSEVTNVTQEQINEACGDEMTRLPEHLERPKHWPDEKSVKY